MRMIFLPTARSTVRCWSGFTVSTLSMSKRLLSAEAISARGMAPALSSRAGTARAAALPQPPGADQGRGVGHVAAEPDQERPPDQVLVRHITPVAAVVAVVAVVAHDEKLAGRHDEFARTVVRAIRGQDVVPQAVNLLHPAPHRAPP